MRRFISWDRRTGGPFADRFIGQNRNRREHMEIACPGFIGLSRSILRSGRGGLVLQLRHAGSAQAAMSTMAAMKEPKANTPTEPKISAFPMSMTGFRCRPR